MGFWDKFKESSLQATTVTPSSLLYDRTLLWLYLVLLLIGLLAVSSASIPVGTRLYSDAFYFAKRDVVYIVLSCITCYFTLQISMEKWEKWHVRLFCIALILLVLVMIPGIGREVNGARRWIPMGLFNFQPAEFAKLALTCFLASYFTRRYDEVRSRKLSAFKPFVVMGVMGCFLLVQPDLGSTVVLFIITFGLLFIVGANFWQFIGLIGVGVLMFVWLVLSSAYRLKRITGFMDPFKDPYGTGCFVPFWQEGGDSLAFAPVPASADDAEDDNAQALKPPVVWLMSDGSAFDLAEGFVPWLAACYADLQRDLLSHFDL